MEFKEIILFTIEIYEATFYTLLKMEVLKKYFIEVGVGKEI